MPIQFRCPGCSEPIEVDDELAGKAAACPYCSRVGTVPPQSTFSDAKAVLARPASAVPQRRGDPSPPPPPNRLGYAALGCTILVAAAFIIPITFLYVSAIRDMNIGPTSRPTWEDADAALQRVLVANPWVGVVLMLSLLAAATGAALAVGSLRQQPGRNWFARISLLICGLMLVCTFSNALLHLLQ